MSSKPPLQISCDSCGRPVDLLNTFKTRCGCPQGSLGCNNCKSIAGQHNSPNPHCCMHCYNRARRLSIGLHLNDLRCPHVSDQKCCHCQKTISFPFSLTESKSLQEIRRAWERLRSNQSLVHHSFFFAMMAQNWGMFSNFHCQIYCNHMMVNFWTEAKKQAFFQLWLLSQLNYPVGPQIIINIHSNPWQSYPRYPLYISREFNWRFRLFPWVRKLISRFAMLFESRCEPNQLFRQSYLHRCGCTKHRMMLFIIRYLMSQHAEIFALSI